MQPDGCYPFIMSEHDSYAEEIKRLTPTALATLRTAMLQGRDTKSQLEAAKQVLEANKSLRDESRRKNELAAMSSSGTMPARFLALAMAGLARLGGVALDPATLEPMVDGIMQADFERDLKPAPAQITTDLVDEAECEEEEVQPQAAGPLPDYLAAVSTPDVVAAKASADAAREREIARLMNRPASR
jgi:hypothetical protein